MWTQEADSYKWWKINILIITIFHRNRYKIAHKSVVYQTLRIKKEVFSGFRDLKMFNNSFISIFVLKLLQNSKI